MAEPTNATRAFGLRFGRNRNAVLYFANSIPIQVRYGNDHSLWDRALNPGSITKGQFQTPDEIGFLKDGLHFAIFPSRDQGLATQRALLMTQSYQNRTIRETMDRYDAGRGPQHEKYIATVVAAAGVPETTKLSQLKPNQFEAVFQAIVQKESGGVGQADRAKVYDFPATLPPQSYAGLINAHGDLDSNAGVRFLRNNVPGNIIPAKDYPRPTHHNARPLPHHVRRRISRAPTSR